MAIERYAKTTKLQNAPLPSTNKYLEDANALFGIANIFKDQASSFNQTAAVIAQKKGSAKGANSVSLDAKGIITRAAIPDAGEYYTDAFVTAQKAAEITAQKSAFDNFNEKFQIENANNLTASTNYEIEFQAFTEQMIEQASPDTKGMVALQAQMVGAATFNSLSEKEMKYQHEETKKLIEDSIAKGIGSLEQMASEGLSKTAEYKHTVEFLTAQMDGGNFYFSTDERSSFESQIRVAGASGDLMTQISELNIVDQLKTINAYKGKGLSIEEKALTKRVVGSKVSENLRIIKEAKEINDDILRTKVVEIQNNISELNIDDGVNVKEVKKFFSQFTKKQMLNPIVATAYRSALNLGNTTEDAETTKLRNETLNTDILNFKSGIMSLADFDAKYRNGNASEISALTRLYEASWKEAADKLKDEKKDTIEQVIRETVANGGMSKSQFREVLTQNTEAGKLAREYQSTYENALKNLDNRNGFSDKKAKVVGSNDHWKKFVFSATKDPKIAFDSSNEQHMQFAMKYVDLYKKIPEEVESALFKWRNFDGNEAVIKNSLGAYKKLLETRKTHLVTSMSDKEYRNLTSAYNGAFQNNEFNASHFDTSFRNLTDTSSEQIDINDSVTALLSDPNVAQKTIVEALKPIVENSTIGSALLKGFTGKGDNIRWLGTNFGDNPDLGIVPNGIKNWFSDIEAGNISMGHGVMLDIKSKIAYHLKYSKSAIGDPSHAARLAMQDLARDGISMSRLISPHGGNKGGDYTLARHTLEAAVEKFGGVPAERFLQQFLINNIDAIKKQLKDSGITQDFGAEGLFGRIVSKDNSLLTGVIGDAFTGNLQFGALTGGDYGSDLLSQISNQKRFNQIIGEKRIYADPIIGQPGVFRIGLVLQSNADREDQKPIWLNIRMQPDEAELSEILRTEYGPKTWGYKLRELGGDPTKYGVEPKKRIPDSPTPFQLGQSLEGIPR
jgi:hypothetical protein